MAVFNITISVKEDGQELTGFPITKSVTVLESGGRSSISRPDSASYTELPLTDLGSITVLYVEADQDYTLRFNDQTDAGLPFSANGVFLMVNGNIPSGATNKASLLTNTGSAATVLMASGGS